MSHYCRHGFDPMHCAECEERRPSPPAPVVTWTKAGKVWRDDYHPDTIRPRDHGKYSRKKKL